MDDLLKWGELAWKVASALGLLVSALFGWGLWSLRKEMVTQQQFQDFRDEHHEEHESLDTRLNAGEVRFARMETTLEHMPDKDDIEALTAALGKVQGTVTGIAATVDGVSKGVNGLRDTVNMLVQNEIAGGRN